MVSERAEFVVPHDSSVGVELEGVASDRGVISSVEDEDDIRRGNAIEIPQVPHVSVTVQSAEVTHSSPHLHQPRAGTASFSPLHLPSTSMASSPHLHQPSSATMASTSHLPSTSMASPPYIRQPRSATMASSSPFHLPNVTMASSPHLHQPSTTMMAVTDLHPGPSSPRNSHLLLRFESSPYPSNHHSFRQRSFVSNDMRAAVSFLPLHQKDITRPHSIPSLCESHSHNLELDPRHLSSRRGGSNRSSLYNTVQAEGYSITAV